MTKLPGTMLNYPGITISDAMQAVHCLAIEKGWWRDNRYLPELLCLVHSEVSECLEAYRKSDSAGIKEELADIVIRVFDIAAAEGIDLEKAIKEKHEYNKTRPFRHGNKVI
jgi:NTP pyrophosphatase (non-canonical NTP hydrolase)